MLLELKNVVASYGNIKALKGISLRRGRQDRHPDRGKRRREIHHHEDHHGRDEAQ